MKKIKILPSSSVILSFLQLEASAMEEGENSKLPAPSAVIKFHKGEKESKEFVQGDAYQNVPVGGILPFAGESAPEGWLVCDGEQYSNKEYPELYEIVKEKYVPHNSWVIEANKRSKVEKYFCVPDLKGHMVVGVDGRGERVTANNLLGKYGGEEKHKLTIDEMPSHNHRVAGLDYLDGASICFKGSVNERSKYTDSTGGDQPHNNMQPYLLLNYIINTGRVGNKGDSNTQNEKINQLEKQIEELKIPQRGCAKAWVIFDGSNPNILNSMGVKSVIRHGVGDYTINFSTPFNSENYCPIFHTWRKEKYGILLVHAFSMKSENREINTRDFYRFTVTKIQENGTRTDAFVSASFYGD